MSHHGGSIKQNKDEDTLDPVEEMIKKSGCLDLHYAVMECYFDNKNDWRKCQKQVHEFRDCMSKSRPELTAKKSSATN